MVRYNRGCYFDGDGIERRRIVGVKGDGEDLWEERRKGNLGGRYNGEY